VSFPPRAHRDRSRAFGPRSAHGGSFHQDADQTMCQRKGACWPRGCYSSPVAILEMPQPIPTHLSVKPFQHFAQSLASDELAHPPKPGQDTAGLSDLAMLAGATLTSPCVTFEEQRLT